MTRTRTFGTMAPITHAPRSSTEPSRWAWFLPGRKGRGHLKRSRSLTIAVLDLRSLAAGGSGREPRQDIQDSFWPMTRCEPSAVRRPGRGRSYFRRVEAVSYTHLTLPTKRIV